MTNNKRIKKHVDVLISGGGIAGSALALALKHTSTLNVAMLEPAEKATSTPPLVDDPRVIALSLDSWRKLNSLDINTENLITAPINDISVTDRRHFGQTQLNATDYGADYFGKVVHLASLNALLHKQLNDNDSDSIINDAIQDIMISQNAVSATTENYDVTAKLLVIAEGAASKTREKLGITSRIENYNQIAIITNIETQLAHKYQAFERFSQHGPIAFLPLPTENKRDGENKMSVVWCVNQDKFSSLNTMSDDALSHELFTLFGSKLGRIKLIGQRSAFPLSLIQAEQTTTHRVACIANAAQMLHPIAGQGFNLGIRDIFDLCQSIERHEVGSYQQLKAYKQTRIKDRNATINATDTLVRTFSHHAVPIVPTRSFMLSLLNTSKTAKSLFADFAVGKR